MIRRTTRMSFDWSDEQRDAITSTKSNVLLSAGAGSGKTEVLSERIYQLVKGGKDLSRFLILTFTNAASAEMKKRIREKIMADPSLGDCSAKIEAAHIETFDSFALFLVRKYALRLGVSPNISIIDNTLLQIERNHIRDEIITHLYENNDKDFLDLISKYCVKNDNQIRSYINSLCSKAEMYLDKNEYLDSVIPQYFDKKRLNSFVDDKYEAMVKQINKAIDQAAELDDPDDADAIINELQRILDKGKDFDSLTIAINTLNFPKKQKGSISNTDYRNMIKDQLGKVLISESDYGDRDWIINHYLSTQKDVETILKIVKEIETRLDSFKKEKSVYSFGDIASLAVKALDFEDIRKEMSEFFEYILVDEYQDTSLIQETVINKLEHNNVCMVGDIKQSIYRFRMADCTLFQNKYDKYYPKDNKFGKLIKLNTSYRSREEIVKLVNEMFEKLMTPETNPINYLKGHEFDYGLKAYSSLVDSQEDYKLKVYNYQLAEGESTVDVETNMIAKDIIHKMNNKYQVYDKDTKVLRTCSFKDFAIIVDRGKAFDDMKTTLSSYGIPARVIYNDPVKDSDVVLVIKNLMILYRGCLNSVFDDDFKHAFVSICRSFICKYDDIDIYNYVKDETYDQSPLMKSINEIVDEGKDLPISKVLTLLVNKFSMYEKLNQLKHFSNNANKIEIITKLAEGMDELGMSLDGLVSYFNDLDTYKLEIDYSDKDVADDAVTLITIHRSKGLEYPIVYMPGLTSSFSNGDKTSFLIDDKYGPVLPITGNTTKSSLFNHLIKIEEARKTFEEKLRLFYVAVTRARERLIMFYQISKKGDTDVYSPLFANKFKTFIKYLHFDTKYGATFTYDDCVLSKAKEQIEDKNISLDAVNQPALEILKKKASKEKDEEVDYKLLEFGNDIHYLLEVADFETKDTSYISDGRMRRYINNVLSSELFKNVKNSQVLREYSFFDEKNVVSGIIDCLLLKDDEVDIIDFKLKNLDDDKYVLQLRTYRDYIEQITDKKIGMYLISAITGEVKEIE